jgi:hypothetical protein
LQKFCWKNLLDTKKITSQPNSDGLIKCLRQRQDSLVRGPEGHLTKLTGKLWARTLFFSFIRSSIRIALLLFPIFGAFPPAMYQDSLALSADALVPCFLLAT